MKKLNRASVAFKVITILSAILNLAASILYLLFGLNEGSSELSKFCKQYVPYFIIALSALSFVAIVVLLILQGVIKNEEKKFADAAAAAVAKLPEETEKVEAPQELSYSGVIKQRLTAIKIRLDVLEEVKDSGVLTENEYKQKRTDIIEELKI